MKHRELAETVEEHISGLYDVREAHNIALMAVEHITGLSRKQLLSDPTAETDYGEDHFADICRRLKNREPIQYITGGTEFCGLPFGVNPGVLIPRPETEELVGWIVGDLVGGKNPHILDIGTGSGAIAVSLARLVSNASVTAVDISPEAVETARDNAENNGTDIVFVIADILKPLAAPLSGQTYDIIVSNPPYIPDSERAAMHDNVTIYEPGAALFVPDGDPLLFYREIGRKAESLLLPGGALYFEVHEKRAGDVCRLMEELGFREVEMRRDINDRPRMVKCLK